RFARDWSSDVCSSDLPYAAEVRITAEAVADAASLDNGTWTTAWQSAGRTGDEWLGPDIVEVIAQLDAEDDVEGVVVCACGFVARSEERRAGKEGAAQA